MPKTSFDRSGETEVRVGAKLVINHSADFPEGIKRESLGQELPWPLRNSELFKFFEDQPEGEEKQKKTSTECVRMYMVHFRGGSQSHVKPPRPKATADEWPMVGTEWGFTGAAQSKCGFFGISCLQNSSSPTANESAEFSGTTKERMLPLGDYLFGCYIIL